MTVKEFISMIVKTQYKGNAELSEQLTKYKAQIWKRILEIQLLVIPQEYKHEPYAYLFAELCMENNLDKHEAVFLLNIMTDSSLWDKIRREYDEEYVEYGFLSIEDGGTAADHWDGDDSHQE